jgi:hypothetical protein
MLAQVGHDQVREVRTSKELFIRVASSVAPHWPRPSVFQAGHIPSWQRSCESYALSPVADDSGRLLLLLSPLLSAVGPGPHFRGLPTDGSVTPWSSPPSPGLPPATRPRPVLSQAQAPSPEPDSCRTIRQTGSVTGLRSRSRSDAAGALDRFRLS